MPGLLSRVLPREQSFFDRFTALAENLYEGAKALTELLENYTDVAAKVGRIKDIEHRGDTMTHEVMTRLNQTFITPFDREDIHELSSKIDDVLDLIDAVASRLVIYRIERVRPGVAELSRLLLESTERVVSAVRVLEQHNHILQHCTEITRLEKAADTLSRRLIAQIFEEETNPIEIIKWKELVEGIEAATDKCEDVANVLEAVTLKSG